MKHNLNEQLSRIHFLTYGKKLNEEDDPKKADLVKDDVNDFYNTLNNIAQTGGLSQQKSGSMSYQKNVETLQIALKLLGYEFPKYGVDGLFGPETANAVNNFKRDNNLLNENSQQLRKTINDLGYDEKNNELTSGGEVNDDITKIVGDILKKYKQINPNVDVVITAGNDKFHQKRNSKHKTGDAIDLVIQPNNSKNSSDLIKLLDEFKSKYPTFNYIDEYKNPSKGSTGGHFHLQYGGKVSNVKSNTQQSNTQQSNLANADEATINLIINKLKSQGIKSGDLKKNIDVNLSSIDIATTEGFAKYSEICQNFINKRQPNPLEITGKMLANGAKDAFTNTGNLVPPELALAQLALEGGIGNKNTNIRPIRTRNPFNVGNTAQKNKNFSSVQEAINNYFNLIAKKYLSKDKNVNDLLNNFVNISNNRYANENPNYENDLKSIISKIKSDYV
jgi:peptidoglycan hydrolase-like protein with peptidoglycan-binding domain